MTLAGELIGRLSGLGIAKVFDPDLDESVPHFSRLLFLLAACVFYCIGGHRMVMAGLLDTFRAIPPGSGLLPRPAGRRNDDARGPLSRWASAPPLPHWPRCCWRRWHWG